MHGRGQHDIECVLQFPLMVDLTVLFPALSLDIFQAPYSEPSKSEPDQTGRHSTAVFTHGRSRCVDTKPRGFWDGGEETTRGVRYGRKKNTIDMATCTGGGEGMGPLHKHERQQENEKWEEKTGP